MCNHFFECIYFANHGFHAYLECIYFREWRLKENVFILILYLIFGNHQNSQNSRKHVHPKISTLKVYACLKKQGIEKGVFLFVEQNGGGHNFL